MFKGLNQKINSERKTTSDKIIALEDQLRKAENSRSILSVKHSNDIANVNKEKELQQREIEELNKRIKNLERLNINKHSEIDRLTKENYNLVKKTRSSSNSSSKVKFTTANKENRNLSNTSFDMKGLDGIDFLSLGRSKYITNLNSQKSEDGQSVTSNTKN